jgi:molybdopterin synthase catalytic subunit
MGRDSFIKISETELDLSECRAWLREDSQSQGAVVEFVGQVRVDENCPELEAISLEHYPGMTEKQLQKIIDLACERWRLGRVMVAHRVGIVRPGEPIVYVGVTSGHRKEAFLGCEFIMDYLKNDATFWKKEIFKDREVWVEAKRSDIDALKRWQ